MAVTALGMNVVESTDRCNTTRTLSCCGDVGAILPAAAPLAALSSTAMRTHISSANTVYRYSWHPLVSQPGQAPAPHLSQATSHRPVRILRNRVSHSVSSHSARWSPVLDDETNPLTSICRNFCVSTLNILRAQLLIHLLLNARRPGLLTAVVLSCPPLCRSYEWCRRVEGAGRQQGTRAITQQSMRLDRLVHASDTNHAASMLDQVHGGYVRKYSHSSSSTSTDMKFNVFLPPQASNDNRLPVLYWLSGLTCTEDNFMQKASPFKAAVQHGLVIVSPDTSPRGLGLPGEKESWDFGEGASFYVGTPHKQRLCLAARAHTAA